MRRFATLIAIVWALLFLAMASGCKSTEAKLCDHAKEIFPDEEITDEQCTERFNQMKEHCGNADAVFDCMLGAENEGAWEDCAETCEPAGEGGE